MMTTHHASKLKAAADQIGVIPVLTLFGNNLHTRIVNEMFRNCGDSVESYTSTYINCACPSIALSIRSGSMPM